MPRRVQDIVPGERRSIRNIPVSAEPVSQKRMPVTPPSSHTVHETRKRKERPKNRIKWLLIALGIIVVIAIIGYVASLYYSKATFHVTPKVIPISVNGTYVAQSTAGTNVLPYTLVILKTSASTTVAATDGQVTSTKSQGTVTLYNSFSSEPVRLIAGTRLSASSGLVYKLTKSIVIPGSTKSGANVVPGTIRTTVIADLAGQNYNLLKKDYTDELHIVAYKGSPKYDLIIAKLYTDITGGWNGAKKTVNSTVLASTTAILKQKISNELSAKLTDSVPEGFMMIGQTSSYTSPVVSGNQPKSAVVTINGTIAGITVKESDLIAKFSNNQSSTSFGNFGFDVEGLSNINISVTNLKDFSIDKRGSLILKAKGDMKLIGKIPVEEIKTKLQGNSLSSTQELFKTYSAVIDSGSGELVPPWAKIPTTPERVTIIIDKP